MKQPREEELPVAVGNLQTEQNVQLRPRRRRRPTDISRKTVRSYWHLRYDFFSKYDYGIKLDEESWYSVTPEKIAEHIAKRCITLCNLRRDGIIIDAFCGSGGNTIQFAKYFKHVIAIDIDPVKIENARHNARIYGVEDNISFIVGDFMKLGFANDLMADVVFLSPPWGGPEYIKAKTFDLNTMIPMDGFKVFELAASNSPRPIIVYYLPRNVDQAQVRGYFSAAGYTVDIEDSFFEYNNKVRIVGCTAYCEVVDTPASTEDISQSQ